MSRVSFFCLSCLVGCGTAAVPSGSDAAGGGSETAPPAQSGSFAATYEVPVPESLSAAATFTLENLNWKLTDDGSVRLAYNLPKDLVGKTISVELEGTLSSDSSDPQTAELSGSAGTASCTLSATAVTCHEQLSGLAPIDSDLAVVEKLASSNFSGPSEQRVSVAQLFSSEPIGIVYIDLTRRTTN